MRKKVRRGKYSNIYRLSRLERQRLLGTFAEALAAVQSHADAVALIEDLFSSAEATMLAKRLAIADELLNGRTYAEVRQALKVSTGTIARVADWLRTAGRGYQLVHARITSFRDRPLVPYRPRRRTTIYNWPILALASIIEGIDDTRRRRIERLLTSLDTKSNLYRDLSNLLAASSPPTTSPRNR